MLPTKVEDEEFDQRNKGAEAAPPAAVPSEGKDSQEAETSYPGEKFILWKQTSFRSENFEYKLYLMKNWGVKELSFKKKQLPSY